MRIRSLVVPCVLFVVLALFALVPACGRDNAGRAGAADSLAKARADSVATAHADSVAVRSLVLDFGTRMKQVSLQAPDSALAGALRSQFGTMATPALILEWVKNPRSAPGRLTSSPWPDRVEIVNLARKSDRMFLVDAEVVERTSADAGADAGRVPVRIGIWKGAGGWRIHDYDRGVRRAASEPPPSVDDPTLTPDRAADIVRAFFAAIREKRLLDAYGMWEAEGAASGQSTIEFVNNWAQIESLEAQVGAPGVIGAAAGSRYVDVPVRFTTVDAIGKRETRAGTFTLRRSVVDGASSKQRGWQIYSMSLRLERAA